VGNLLEKSVKSNKGASIKGGKVAVRQNTRSEDPAPETGLKEGKREGANSVSLKKKKGQRTASKEVLIVQAPLRTATKYQGSGGITVRFSQRYRHP